MWLLTKIAILLYVLTFEIHYHLKKITKRNISNFGDI